MYPTDHHKILHTPRQCNCRDMCNIPRRSAKHTSNQSTQNPDRIPNSTKKPSVGRAPGEGLAKIELEKFSTRYINGPESSN